MNVLVLFTDQQQRGTLGAYGNTTVCTPNLDKFAQQATVFDGGICPQPLCVPSRCSMWSGVYPHTHGVPANYNPLPRRFHTLGDMVVDHGVRTGYLGKWHLGHEVLPQRGFEQFYKAVDDNYTKPGDRAFYGLSGYGQWLVEHGIEPNRHDPPGFPPSFTREYTATLGEELSKPAFIAEQACKFLEGRKDEPFLLACGFLEPHNPYTGPFDAMHDISEIELPDNFHTDPLDGWPARNAAFQQWACTRDHQGDSGFGTEDEWRGVIARYYGLCHLMDKYVGKILDKLDELGLADDTMVIFTSDHGDMMASHGMIMKGLMFEESMGVPLMVRVPGVDGGRRVAETVSLMHVVPTALDAMGIDKPAQVAEDSILPLIRGQRDENPDTPQFCEWNGMLQAMHRKHADIFDDVKDHSIRSIRTARWKLNVNLADRSELYDLQNDPGEMINLIDDTGHRDVVDDLYGQMCAWQRRTDDPLALTHPCETA